MDKKIVLILVDGMRPDGMMKCGNPYAEQLLKDSTYTLCGRTVMPSVTLPCHMSLFHSVDPERHGVLTNVYTPQVRPIDGIFDVLHKGEKSTAFFSNWEELRDLSRPGALRYSLLMDQHQMDDTDCLLTEAAITYIRQEKPDFTFLYLGETDEKGGHSTGWMSDNYLRWVSHSLDCIKSVRESIPEEYDIILTADHGGHNRIHGTEMDEDMLIPVVFNGPSFAKNKEIMNVSIKDIAPTVTSLLGVKPAKEWEGKALF